MESLIVNSERIAACDFSCGDQNGQMLNTLKIKQYPESVIFPNLSDKSTILVPGTLIVENMRHILQKFSGHFLCFS